MRAILVVVRNCTAYAYWQFHARAGVCHSNTNFIRKEERAAALKFIDARRYDTDVSLYCIYLYSLPVRMRTLPRLDSDGTR